MALYCTEEADRRQRLGTRPNYPISGSAAYLEPGRPSKSKSEGAFSYLAFGGSTLGNDSCENCNMSYMSYNTTETVVSTRAPFLSLLFCSFLSTPLSSPAAPFVEILLLKSPQVNSPHVKTPQNHAYNWVDCDSFRPDIRGIVDLLPSVFQPTCKISRSETSCAI
jgi:hypothetical protein